MCKLFGTISFIGFLIVFGSVGSLEFSSIGFVQAIIQFTIGFIVMFLGAYFGDFMMFDRK